MIPPKYRYSSYSSMTLVEYLVIITIIAIVLGLIVGCIYDHNHRKHSYGKGLIGGKIYTPGRHYSDKDGTHYVSEYFELLITYQGEVYRYNVDLQTFGRFKDGQEIFVNLSIGGLTGMRSVESISENPMPECPERPE